MRRHGSSCASRRRPGHALHSLLLCALLISSLISAGTADAAARSLGSGRVVLRIHRDGIVRVTGNDLLRHGVDWSGVQGSSLALISHGRPLPRLVSTSGPLTPRSYVEFYGRRERSRYTWSNVYYLQVDSARAIPAPALDARPRSTARTTVSTAAFSESHRATYDPMGGGDGWYYRQLTAAGAPARQTARARLPGKLRKGRFTFSLSLRGVSAIAGSGFQHHLVAAVNGHVALDLKFNGIDDRTVRVEKPASWLRPDTTITLTVPGDVRNKYHLDAIDIRRFGLRYPRSIRARHGYATLQLRAGQRVDVPGFFSPSIRAWRDDGSSGNPLTGYRVLRRGQSYTLSMSAPRDGRYVLVETGHLSSPDTLSLQKSTSSIVRAPAELLVIGPRALLQPLAPLVAYHRNHGTAVAITTISDVYTAYGEGIMEPAAIRSYIADAHERFGVRAVLLVGGDTYDYHGYLRCTPRRCPANAHDASDVPSPYVRDPNFGQIPSDEWYVDGASGPTVAIGRLPALRPADVRGYVGKALALVKAKREPLRALFASDRQDPEFRQTSDDLAALLPAGAQARHADAGTMGAKAARARLLAGIAAGDRLVNYVGHGSLEQWGSPPGLLLASDARALPSGSVPALYLGWGCQTAYHVDPTDLSLNAALTLAPRGAVAALGSSGIDAADPQAELARSVYRELFGDPTVTTVGEAIRQGEVKALAANGDVTDPLRSYMLFGDPALPLAPFRGAS